MLPRDRRISEFGIQSIKKECERMVYCPAGPRCACPPAPALPGLTARPARPCAAPENRYIPCCPLSTSHNGRIVSARFLRGGPARDPLSFWYPSPAPDQRLDDTADTAGRTAAAR